MVKQWTLQGAELEYNNYIQSNYRIYVICDLTTGEILETIFRATDIDAILYAGEHYKEYGKKVAVLRNS